VNLLADFRQQVTDLIKAKLPTPVAVHDRVPNDVAELPCVVVGLPGATDTSVSVVYDLSLDVYAIGRRQGADDSEGELVVLADDLWTLLGGTRGALTATADVIDVTRIDPRVITIAGLDCSTYVITARLSAATC
jgi:hypothetical protein